MSQPSQPVLQPDTGIFWFVKASTTTRYKIIDNVNFPHEAVIQYLGHVVDTQPSLVTDNLSVNKLVNHRSNAPLPKAPTFDGTGWKGFIHQFELWCSTYGLLFLCLIILSLLANVLLVWDTTFLFFKIQSI